MFSWIVVSHVLDLPSYVLFKVGDRRNLTCSMSSCPEKVKFVWRSLEDKPLFAAIKSQDKESVLIFDNVMKDYENSIVCKAICQEETKQATTKIKVYCEFLFQFYWNFSRLHNALLVKTGVSCHNFYFSKYFSRYV